MNDNDVSDEDFDDDEFVRVMMIYWMVKMALMMRKNVKRCIWMDEYHHKIDGNNDNNDGEVMVKITVAERNLDGMLFSPVTVYTFFSRVHATL